MKRSPRPWLSVLAGRLRRLVPGLRRPTPPPPPPQDPSIPPPPPPTWNARDDSPWEHPCLKTDTIARFRSYSEAVWDLARAHDARADRPLRVALAVNIAQSMYKWARLLQEAGDDATLFLHPQDQNALSAPEWEEFDGSFPDLHDLAGFRAAHPDLRPAVPVRVPPATYDFLPEDLLRNGNRRTLLQRLDPALARSLGGALFCHSFQWYLHWAHQLQDFEVSCSASLPIAAYLSGKPYCAFSIGGDLQIDCGLGSPYGLLVALAFHGARFLTLTNPHPLGHCRRLGLTNAVYLPHPMDDHRYCPGEGQARREWEQAYGPGVYVLATARIDNAVKGNGSVLADVVTRVARARPAARFLFLSWGADADRLRGEYQARGLGHQVLFLPPVGKRRLIDYYRSCDIVLDQFVYGYYGGTGLEAASVGKPIVMRIRPEHYAPLYRGDVAPVDSCRNLSEVGPALLRLIDAPERRRAAGEALRAWLVRTHGRERTVPVLRGLLRLAADRVPLPPGLDNPLADPETEVEAAYHAACLRPAA